MRLSVGCVQMPVEKGKPLENARWLERVLASVQPGAYELIVLPEMWTTDFDGENASNWARESQEALAILAAQARRLNTYFAGSLLRHDAKRAAFANSLVVLDPTGSVVAEYDKIHLFRPLQEHTFFAPGNRLVTLDTAFGKWGMSICYDLRFPELYRAQAVQGAQLFIIPAAWPASRVEHWRTLLQARAVENQVFVVGVNRVGTSSKGFDFGGHSMIVSPWGETLWEGAGSEAGVFGASLNFADIEAARRKITVWDDRQPELYKTWND